MSWTVTGWHTKILKRERRVLNKTPSSTTNMLIWWWLQPLWDTSYNWPNWKPLSLKEALGLSPIPTRLCFLERKTLKKLNLNSACSMKLYNVVMPASLHGIRCFWFRCCKLHVCLELSRQLYLVSQKNHMQ